LPEGVGIDCNNIKSVSDDHTHTTLPHLKRAERITKGEKHDARTRE